jgi:hypothetical protein
MGMLKNPKRESFAQSVANGTSLVDAARSAGYETSRAYKTASELRKRADIAARIQEILEKRTKLNVVHDVYGMRECLAETDEALQMARTNGQPSHMVAAITLKAKLVGLLVERRQIDYKNVGELSDAELESLIQSAEASAAGKRAIDKASEPEQDLVNVDRETLQ